MGSGQAGSNNGHKAGEEQGLTDKLSYIELNSEVVIQKIQSSFWSYTNPFLCLDHGIIDTQLRGWALESECSDQITKDFVGISKMDYFLSNSHLKWAYGNALYIIATIIPAVALPLTSHAALGKELTLLLQK